jgi:hypothetical protein
MALHSTAVYGTVSLPKKLIFELGQILKLTQYRGMGVETIAPLLGHANLRTVMHLSQEHLDRSMVLYGVEQPKPFGDSSPVSVSESKVQ